MRNYLLEYSEKLSSNILSLYATLKNEAKIAFGILSKQKENTSSG